MASELASSEAELRLSPEERLIVQEVLAEHLPGREIRVFGSRAHGRSLKPWSDLDLAVMGEAPAAATALAAVAAAFDDSDLPFRVDVLAWSEASPAIRQAILLEGLAVVEPAGSAVG